MPRNGSYVPRFLLVLVVNYALTSAIEGAVLLLLNRGRLSKQAVWTTTLIVNLCSYLLILLSSIIFFGFVW